MSANFYTNVSFTIKGTKEQIKWLESNENFNMCGADVTFIEPDTLWLFSFENVCLNALSVALKEYLLEFDPKGYVVFQWCCCADRPVAGGVGGGTLAVTTEHVHGQTTGDTFYDLSLELDEIGLHSLNNEESVA